MACGVGPGCVGRVGGHRGRAGGGSVRVGGMGPINAPCMGQPKHVKSLPHQWKHDPVLSYVFAGLFDGPTGQAARLDEARDDVLYELEVALGMIPDIEGIIQEHELPLEVGDAIILYSDGITEAYGGVGVQEMFGGDEHVGPVAKPGSRGANGTFASRTKPPPPLV